MLLLTPGPRGWWARFVLGGLLGWGVRLRAPLRALFAGVSVTATGLYLVGTLRPDGAGFWNWAALGRCVAVAAAPVVELRHRPAQRPEG